MSVSKSVSNDYRSIGNPKSRYVSQVAATQYIVRLRIKLFIPQPSQQAPILSQLISDVGLSVNLFSAVLEPDNRPNQLDLELCGTIAQVNSGLSYLESLNIVIKGRPNPDGDSWDY